MERPKQRDDPVDTDAIGYRNVDEEAAYDEQGGTQGEGAGDPPADEEQTGEEPDGIAGGG